MATQEVVQEVREPEQTPDPQARAREGTMVRLLADLDELYEEQQEFLTSKRDGGWTGESLSVVRQRVLDLAAGLVRLPLKKGERVAIMAGDRPEWLMSDLAIQHAAAVVVPIDRFFDLETITRILKETRPKVVFVEDKEDVDRIRQAFRKSKLTGARTVVVFEPLERRRKNTLSFQELEEEGAEAPAATHQAVKKRCKAVTGKTVALIDYTAGATGPPKGVCLTQQGLHGNVVDSLRALPLRPGMVCLSHLPVSRPFERIVGQYTMMAAGATIAYAQDLSTVPEDILEVRPHVMVGTPRLLERMHASLETSLRGPWLKRKVFDWAMGVAQEAVDHGLRGEPLPPRSKKRLDEAERLVFSKVRQKIGGRLESYVCWGAPLPQRLETFFWGLGIGVYPGYGLTEAGGLVACNTRRARRFGSVGRPLEGVEVKIEGPGEEEGPWPAPAEGEILVKGDLVMKGYWKDEKATRRVVKKKWLHTGDLGRLDEDGFLYVLGRKAEVITLSGGHKVAPWPIEQALRERHYIDQVVLFGQGRDHLTALLVPDFDALAAFAQKEGLATAEPSTLVNVMKVQDVLKAEVGAVNQGLDAKEQIKRFRILPRPLSREEGELTSMLMVDREAVKKRFADVVDEMYDQTYVMDAAGLNGA